jgi:hypothetical protein
MKTIKNLLGMALLVGLINPFVFTNHQHWYQGFVCLLCAFIGSGLIFGFGGYRVGPRDIGNAGVMPKINQTWMFFFIGAVANLLWATLYV